MKVKVSNSADGFMVIFIYETNWNSEDSKDHESNIAHEVLYQMYLYKLLYSILAL